MGPGLGLMPVPPGIPTIVFAPAPVQPPPPKDGIPPGFVEQLKEQMCEMAGTSEKLCNYGRVCRSVSCPNTHPEGRDIEDDPQSVICRFQRRCKRNNCFYVHPTGRDIDEDPSKGKCKLGEECTNPSCIYTHPETRKAITQLTCFACGARGHVARECPKDPRVWHPRVAIRGFPEEWTRDGCDALAQRIAEELEVFGQLIGPPEVQGLGDQVFATFEDAELAKQAIAALHGEVFKIDFCSPPPPVRGSGGFGGGGGGAAAARDKRCTIFVGNLPLDATEEDLREVFSRVGVVESFRVVLDRETRKSKGYGFCDYAHPDLAADALKYLSDVEVGGRRLRLCPAEESLGSRHSGGDRGGGEGGGGVGSGRYDMQIEGFPQRWTVGDLREFLLCAIKVKPSQLNIEMAPPSEERGCGQATVGFANENDARLALSDLEGQKIAGKPLSATLPNITAAIEDQNGDKWGSEKWSRHDRDWRRRSSRSRSRSQSYGGGGGGRRRRGRRDDWSGYGRKERDAMTTVFIDELVIPRREALDPCPEDREVWVDPLPDEDEVRGWNRLFGEVEDVFRLPDSSARPRGYVRFRHHIGALRCVDRGAARWSESERWLASQQHARKGDRSSVYSENMISKILGTRGDVIAGLKDEVGAKALMLRGEGLGENDKMESSRVHFVCKCPQDSAWKLQPALERAVEKIYGEVRGKSTASSGGHERSKDLSGESAPWRPPSGAEPPPPSHWMYPPPGGGPPPGPPGWYPPPHWGPPPGPHLYPPPPWAGHGPGPGPGPGGPLPPPGGGPLGPPPHPPYGGCGPLEPPPGVFRSEPPPLPGPSGAPPFPPLPALAAGEAAAPALLGAAAGEGAAPATEANGERDRERGRDRDRGRRRRREEPPEGEAGKADAGPPPERRRRRRREAQEATVPEAAGEAGEGSPPGPEPAPAPAAGAGAASDAAAAAGSGFLERLPDTLTPGEQALGEAVLHFLRTWGDGDAANPPNMVHLGGDARVREFKAAALPREVSLKAWIKQRFSDRVEVRGQSVVALR